MSTKHPDSVGEGIHPPFLLGGMMGLVLLYKAFDLPSPLHRKSRRLGIPLMLAGLALGGSAVAAQSKAGTAVNPTQPTTALVDSGPYRFTRNPIYLGMAMIFSGFAIFMNALWALVLLPVMVLTLDRGMVAHEEAYLEGKFGQAYTHYKDRVHRWI